MGRIRPGRLLLTVFILAFAVFFGLDLASRGMERVQGPAENVGKPSAVAHQPETKTAAAGTKAGSAAAGSTAASAAGTAGTAGSKAAGQAQQGQAASKAGQPAVAANGKQTASAAQTAAAPPKIEVKESFLNHLSNRIGDALHHIAKGLMSLVVSLFDALIT